MGMKMGAAVLAILLPVAGFGQVWQVTSTDIGETAIVLDVDDLRNDRLPRIIHERGIPPLFTADIALACLSVHARSGEKVVYLPAGRRCLHSDALPRASQRLADRVAPTGDSKAGPVTALVLRPKPPEQPKALSCTCPPPTNDPPVVSLQQGNGQQVEPNAVIGTIRFFASDPDTATLNGSFTHKLNDGVFVAGLPAGLASSCSSGAGTLTCDIDGNAPAVLGDYVIRFTVTDGNSDASAPADLAVRTGAPPPNRPPVATVEQGASQQAAPGVAIQTIRFLATDPDMDSLQQGFSFRRDGGAPEPGLPGGLSASCTADAGSLSCDIDGLAPLELGAYVIDFSASDGELQASVSAIVNVETSGPPPDNEPPVASVVLGASQEAEPGAAIQTIRFAATDPDSATLVQEFSYRRDGGAGVPGLPTGLVATCLETPNALSCDIDGTAPGEEGDFVITFVASDGELDASTSASLRVRSTESIILIDGFELVP